MTASKAFCPLLLCAVAACAPSVATPPPAPALVALDCVYRLAEHRGFITAEGTDWFPWRIPQRDNLSFAMQRGEGPTRELVWGSVTPNAETGAVVAQAWGGASWLNSGVYIRAAGSAAEDVARRIQQDCSVPARAV